MSKIAGEAAKISQVIGLSIDGKTDLEIDATIRKMVAAEVVTSYALLDGVMNDLIVDYFLNNQLRDLGKFPINSEANRIFEHYILEEMYPLKKMDIIRQFEPLSDSVMSAMRRINELRNALAHSFTPELRRRHAKAGQVLYTGQNIFTEKGLLAFIADVVKVSSRLIEIETAWLAADTDEPTVTVME